MTRQDEVFDGIVKRVFGPAAELGGSIGTVKRPGELRVVVAGRTIGRGANFADALQAGLATAAGETAANKNTAV